MARPLASNLRNDRGLACFHGGNCGDRTCACGRYSPKCHCQPSILILTQRPTTFQLQYAGPIFGAASRPPSAGRSSTLPRCQRPLNAVFLSFASFHPTCSLHDWSRTLLAETRLNLDASRLKEIVDCKHMVSTILLIAKPNIGTIRTFNAAH